MTKDVLKHLLVTYARLPLMWVGWIIEIVRTILLRVLIVLFIAQAASQIAAGDFDAAQFSALLFIIFYIVGILLGAIGEIILIWAEDKEYGRIMVDYYRILSTKDMSFYRDHQTGYLTSLFRQYLDGMLQVARTMRGEITRTAISLVAPVAVLFIVSPPVGFVAFGIIIIQIIYVMWSSKRLTKYRKVSHEMYRKITGEVSDTLTNIVAFRGAARPKESLAHMKVLADKEVEAFWKRRSLMAIFDVPRLILTAVGIGAGIMIIAEYRDPAIVGLVVLTFGYMLQIMRNVADLPNMISQFDDAVTKVHPTLEILDTSKQKVADPSQPIELQVTDGIVTVDNITFSYPSANNPKKTVNVFNGLSLTIAGGEHVGIVGLSGAGKSTLASLLMRFDDVDTGSISIDGTDIRLTSQTDLHRNIAYVPQEPLLFHRSIKENILYFNPKATKSQLEKAAKAAHAHDFITTLPDGYNTIVGERGVKLSGGQKQRIVIARAILKDAPIIIFDEATSALDSESEHIIQEALPEIIGKHTAVVIAHRLSTVAALDRIVVMHDGKIVEEGNHEALLNKKGRYYNLWQRQTRNAG